MVLGYLIYRGAITINLSKFFTWTGAFLIVVAAGVLAYGVHDLQEAGFLPGLNDLAFDVSDTVDATSWYGALLKGIFNFSPATTKLEAAAWLPLRDPGDGSLPVLRPPSSRRPSRKQLSMPKPLSLVGSLTALLLATPFLAACTENADGGGTTDGGTTDARALTVESTDDACNVSAAEAPAGTLTFDVTNTGSQVTEFYLLAEDGLRIVAEVENVGPALNRELTVNAPAGTYVTACKPGM